MAIRDEVDPLLLLHKEILRTQRIVDEQRRRGRHGTVDGLLRPTPPVVEVTTEAREKVRQLIRRIAARKNADPAPVLQALGLEEEPRGQFGVCQVCKQVVPLQKQRERGIRGELRLRVRAHDADGRRCPGGGRSAVRRVVAADVA